MIPKLFPPPVLAALHADLQKNEWFLEMPVLHHPSGKRRVKIVRELHDLRFPNSCKQINVRGDVIGLSFLRR